MVVWWILAVGEFEFFLQLSIFSGYCVYFISDKGSLYSVNNILHYLILVSTISLYRILSVTRRVELPPHYTLISNFLFNNSRQLFGIRNRTIRLERYNIIWL